MNQIVYTIEGSNYVTIFLYVSVRQPYTEAVKRAIRDHHAVWTIDNLHPVFWNFTQLTLFFM
jgi:hypothetical protein